MSELEALRARLQNIKRIKAKFEKQRKWWRFYELEEIERMIKKEIEKLLEVERSV